MERAAAAGAGLILDIDDLLERNPDDLLGALLSHWQLGAQRTPGVPKVRVFSPTPGEDGWEDRLALHQVFPLLVHACMFGGGYGARAAAAARRFA